MHSFNLFGRVAPFLSFLIVSASAVILQDFDLPSIDRRAALTGLDLKNAETFMWGDSALNDSSRPSSVLGNLTVYMPGETENILSMSRFRGMTNSIECTNNSISIAFIDDATFAYAQRTWDWVNGADNHSFVMVAGTGDCGHTHRTPYVVSTLEYDEVLNVAHLAAVPSQWRDVAHTFDLHVGHMPSPLKLRKRFGSLDYDKDLKVDFNHKLPNPSIRFPDPDLEVAIACPDCGTTGEFDISFHLHTVFLIPKDATITLRPKGVSAFIKPKVTISAQLSGAKDLKYSFPDIPIEAIEIPEVFTLGPVIETAIGISAGPVLGSASIATGVTYALPDTAEVQVDLLDTKLTHTDWSPTVTKDPVTVDARISAELKLYAKAAVALKAEALGLGYEAQVKIEPYIKGSLQAIAAPAGACPNDPLKQPFGVGFFPSYGISLIAEINNVEKEHDPIAIATIANLNEPLPSLCFGFGPDGNAPATATATLTGLPTASSIGTGSSLGHNSANSTASVHSTPAASLSSSPTPKSSAGKYSVVASPVTTKYASSAAPTHPAAASVHQGSTIPNPPYAISNSTLVTRSKVSVSHTSLSML